MEGCVGGVASVALMKIVVVSVETHVRPSNKMGDTKYRRIVDSKQTINMHPMFTRHSCSSKA
jgi:hypothetical protein